jgi:hypothetical protein
VDNGYAPWAPRRFEAEQRRILARTYSAFEIEYLAFNSKIPLASGLKVRRFYHGKHRREAREKVTVVLAFRHTFRAHEALSRPEREALRRGTMEVTLGVRIQSYSAQIGLVKADKSRLVDRDTQVDLKHGLEHRPCYPLSVKVDATRNASAYRLEEIFVAHGDDENLAVSQVPALQLPLGGGVQGDPQRPGESFS